MADGVVLKDTLNSHWKQNKNGFGFRMLQKMGWTEEKGLGKNEDGISDAVKVKRREEGLGLGMENVVDDKVGSKAWSSTVSSFNSVLEMLKSSYKPADDDEDSNDKKKKKKSKKEKKEKKDKPLITVGIKYKKFRDAKTLSDKSFHDRQAIFGHGHVHRELTTTETTTTSSSSIRHDGDHDTKVEVKKTTKKTIVEDVESLNSESNESSSEEDEVKVQVVKKEKKEKKAKDSKKKKESKKRKREEEDDE